MGYANKRETKKDGLFWEARYKAENGKYKPILDVNEKPVRYWTPESAKEAADRAEFDRDDVALIAQRLEECQRVVTESQGMPE